jgi:lipopolysaccharide biosynthesis glycosyltransferase
MKKNLAILFGITADYSFALANVLAGLREHSPGLADDIIVYHDGLSGEEQARLNAILPCRFLVYEPPVELPEHHLTNFSFSRFEAFGLLNEYRHVLWLDVDILIRGDVSGILQYDGSGVAACFEPQALGSLFPKPLGHVAELSGCGFSKPYFNTGVLLLSDVLEKPEQMREWLYMLSSRFPETCLQCADMGVINLMVQVFGLDVVPLPDAFNNMIFNHWNPFYQRRRDARLIHAITADKFWNYWCFREWDARYRQWIAMGGLPSLEYRHPFRRPWMKRVVRTLRFYRKKTSRYRHPARWFKETVGQ